jgi:hypothetical protein
MITLQDTDDAYYYVHRSLYDQAVILEDRYGQNPVALTHAIAKDNNNAAVEYFAANAPKPINILGYFLALVEEGLDNDMELLCGAIHVMSTVIDMRKFILTDFSLRTSISFSLHIREEYEVLWDRFFQEATFYRSGSTSGSGSITEYDDTDGAADEIDWGNLFSEYVEEASTVIPSAEAMPEVVEEEFNDGLSLLKGVPML